MAQNIAEKNSNAGGPPEAGFGITTPRIIVHGGMYTSMNKDVEEYMRVLKIAAKEGHATLQRNGTAVDAVEKAVIILEENDNFNAGHGSFFNESGDVECDAMIMDGHTLEAGGVAAVRDVPHPVKLSKKILSASEHCILSGQGAVEFARKNGIEVAPVRGRTFFAGQSHLNNQEGINHLSNAGEMDTVSAIAIDYNGYLACATSSGGMPGKAPGRIGDVPLIGCGGYANERGAATTSGHGELIIRMTLAREVVYNIEKQQQDAQTAVDNAIREVELRLGQREIRDPYIGVIAMDSQGNFGIAAHESELLPWATISGNLMEYGREPGRPEGQEFVDI